MNRPARRAHAVLLSIQRKLRAEFFLFLFAPVLCVSGASNHLVFAEGRITCAIVSSGEPVPAQVLSALPIAMNAAVEHIGAPMAPARLTIRLQPHPSFHQRVRAWFRADPAAIQKDDEILLQAGDDPLKLAFRIAHELSHWLVSKQYPVRPPLWLDEGLAQIVGAAAAEACARTLKQNLDRPRPPKLDRDLFPLDELAALQAYPQSEARSAAFYWQAEALVGAIRQRLGPAEFAVYLGLLCSPEPPVWQEPLRKRWYFSDWDMDWLAQQIRPASENAVSKPK